MLGHRCAEQTSACGIAVREIGAIVAFSAQTVKVLRSVFHAPRSEAENLA
jgi:hypothetical protein